MRVCACARVYNIDWNSVMADYGVTYRWGTLTICLRWISFPLRSSTSPSCSTRFLFISGFAKDDSKSFCRRRIVHIPLTKLWQWPSLVLLLTKNNVRHKHAWFNVKFAFRACQGLLFLPQPIACSDNHKFSAPPFS